MPKEMFLFLGAIVGALAAYITARTTGRHQLQIAETSANKDVLLQEERLRDERIKSEVCLEREKLEKLHIILSAISFENSQTMSYIQSASNMTLQEYRARYIENCRRLHEAKAISDIYYPEMSDAVGEVLGQSNMFWGQQEGVLRTDINEKAEVWREHLQEALKASSKISDRVRSLQYKISERSGELSKTLHRTGR